MLHYRLADPTSRYIILLVSIVNDVFDSQVSLDNRMPDFTNDAVVTLTF